MRHKLYTKWGSLKKWYKYQPLDYVKDYFGVKIGLYFAWLGYYTYMLLLASIVGIICFLYSLNYMVKNTIRYVVIQKRIIFYENLNIYYCSEEICTSELTMCPLCDYWCDFWKLKETCIQAKVTSLLDNPVTVFFAIFMSFWGELI